MSDRYYLRDRRGEPMMAYDDILDGKEALDDAANGTELIRAEDGAVLGRKVGSLVQQRKERS